MGGFAWHLGNRARGTGEAGVPIKQPRLGKEEKQEKSRGSMECEQNGLQVCSGKVGRQFLAAVF